MFLIGAPLGALIRKGGFGLPIVLALIIFLSYHFAGTFFKNSAEDGSISPLLGSTLPSIVLFGFSLLVIQRARADKGVFDFGSVLSRLRSSWGYLKLKASVVKRIFAKK
jgi:lipopolysaccharide export system permease protein